MDHRDEYALCLLSAEDKSECTDLKSKIQPTTKPSFLNSIFSSRNPFMSSTSPEDDGIEEVEKLVPEKSNDLGFQLRAATEIKKSTA